MYDLRLYLVNTFSLVTVQFTTIDYTLKIILLLTTIGYTIHRWYLLTKK